MPIKRKRRTPELWHRFPADPSRVNMGERYYRDMADGCVAEVHFHPPFRTLLSRGKKPAYRWAAREGGPPDPLGRPTLWPLYERDFGLDEAPGKSVFTGAAKTLKEAKSKAMRACSLARRKRRHR